jgi:hypothetical protein
MVGVRRTELEVCTTCGQKLSEEPIVEFSSAVVALKTLDVVSSGINLGLVVLIGGDASLLFLIRKEVYGGPSGVVVNEYDTVLMATFSRYGEWTAGIGVYELEWSCSPLDFSSNEFLLVFRLQTDIAHSI